MATEKYIRSFTSEKRANKAIKRAEKLNVSTDRIETLTAGLFEVTFYCTQEELNKIIR
jgi:hypothetical protein